MNKAKKGKEKLKKKVSGKPKLEDFYDIHDPRGCSSSEYEEFEKALKEWKKL